MTRHALLNAQDHRDLKVLPQPSAALGDAQMACLAVPTEFRRLQNEFPIVFRYDPERGFSALALMGFEAGENLFLDGEHWDAAYRPLALGVQPFLIGLGPDGSDPQVHIDLDHPRVTSGDEGVRLFDDDGQPTPLVEAAADRLGELHAGVEASADFFAALDRHRLLEPFSMDVTMDDGSQQRLVGYHLINEERLRSLEPGALAELHAADHLMPAFMAIASLSNLPRLVQRRNRRANG